MKIEIEKIKASLDCDDAFIAQLFESFIQESTESINAIEKAFPAKDWKIVKGASHKMLGSTRIFEIAELTDLLDEIKTDAEKETNLDKMKEKIDRLKVLHKECIDIMAEFNHRMLELKK